MQRALTNSQCAMLLIPLFLPPHANIRGFTLDTEIETCTILTFDPGHEIGDGNPRALKEKESSVPLIHGLISGTAIAF